MEHPFGLYLPHCAYLTIHPFVAVTELEQLRTALDEARRKKIRADEGRIQAEEEKIRADEGRIQAEEERIRAEEERIRAEEERIRAEEALERAEERSKAIAQVSAVFPPNLAFSNYYLLTCLF